MSNSHVCGGHRRHSHSQGYLFALRQNALPEERRASERGSGEAREAKRASFLTILSEDFETQDVPYVERRNQVVVDKTGVMLFILCFMADVARTTSGRLYKRLAIKLHSGYPTYVGTVPARS